MKKLKELNKIIKWDDDVKCNDVIMKTAIIDARMLSNRKRTI